MKRIPTLIDCDTGIDDAMALVLACASDRLDIRGVTAAAGNVELPYTLANTLNVLKLLGREEIPVAAGADRPLARELMTAGHVHGGNGLRGCEFEQNAGDALVEKPAWDLMREVLLASKDKVLILALAPLTNVAILLDLYPEVKPCIDRIVFMGASVRTGNPTPVATFNVLVDPEAYRKVIFAGVPFYAVPLDTTREAYLSAGETEAIRHMDSPVADMVTGILSGYGSAAAKEDEKNEELLAGKRRFKGTARLHDPAAVAFAIAPEFYTVRKYYGDVECRGELTAGYTFFDMEDYYGKSEEEKNIYLVETINREGFVDLFLDAVRFY